MLISLALFQCELASEDADLLVGACGHSVLHPIAASVPAREVIGHTMSADPNHEVVRIACDGGWTVLADESGRLPEARKLWKRETQSRGVRSLLMLADDEIVAFALHEPDGSARAVASCDGHYQAKGRPLAVEGAFAPKRLTAGDLLLLAQSVGVDLERLNHGINYRLLACRRGPLDFHHSSAAES